MQIFFCDIISINVFVFLIFRDKEESCSRKYSLDGITLSSEYASVILPKNSTRVEKGDALVFNNGMDDRKSKTKYVVI